MELNEINNFVQNANEEQLKAFGFLGQWMMENVPKYCTCASKCNQNCERDRDSRDSKQILLEYCSLYFLYSGFGAAVDQLLPFVPILCFLYFT